MSTNGIDHGIDAYWHELRAEAYAEVWLHHQWWLVFRTVPIDPAVHAAEVAARDIHADGTPRDGTEHLYGDNCGVPHNQRVPSNPGGLTPRQRIGSAKCFS